MIQMYTYLDVADNTGAKECMCIKVLGGTRRRYAGLGDIIIASVKKAIPGGDVKPGDVVKGVIVRLKKATRRDDGSCVRVGRRYLKDGSKERYCKNCDHGLGRLSKPRPQYAHEDEPAGQGEQPQGGA